MGENKYDVFDNNINEIKELSEKLKEPLEEPINILYYDIEKKKIKYKGGYIDKKREGKGISYNEQGKIIYIGYFSNDFHNGFGNEFHNGKLEYEGYFKGGRRDGKGILYYDNSSNIYFNGIFKSNKYFEGIEYDPNGNKIYEGLFMNNKPKEGKNIKYYLLNGKLEYEGDFLDGQYHGHGTLYKEGHYEEKGIFSENKYLYYVGDFKYNEFNGKGKLYMDHCLGKYLFFEGNFINSYYCDNGKFYYQNKQVFYEGQIKNENINGKGIQYYNNGKIKFKGNFLNNKCMQGIYYSPEGIQLYEGNFKNEIPLESNNIIIYDNNTNKIYEGSIRDGLYQGKGIEYCLLKKDIKLFEGYFNNNEFILPNIEIKEQKDEKKFKKTSIVLLSKGDIPGKTCLVNRLLGLEYSNENLATIGIEKVDITFENNNSKYKLLFWDTAGAERFRSVSLKNAKYSNFAIYLFDLNCEYNEISMDFINDIREQNKNIKIYIVGNRLDLLNENKNKELINREYFERFRSKTVEAMKNNLVDKYFEISAKTGEGVEKLLNSIKLDSLIYLKSLNESGNASNDQKRKKIIKKKNEKCVIF